MWLTRIHVKDSVAEVENTNSAHSAVQSKLHLSWRLVLPGWLPCSAEVKVNMPDGHLCRYPAKYYMESSLSPFAGLKKNCIESHQGRVAWFSTIFLPTL